MTAEPPDDSGGQGDGAPTRSELALVRRAVRQDWPIPADVQAKVIQALVNLVEPEFITASGKRTTPRLQIAAARTLASFASVSLKQQSIDLKRDALSGAASGDDRPLSELVPEALDREREFEALEHGPTPDPGGAGPGPDAPPVA